MDDWGNLIFNLDFILFFNKNVITSTVLEHEERSLLEKCELLHLFILSIANLVSKHAGNSGNRDACLGQYGLFVWEKKKKVHPPRDVTTCVQIFFLIFSDFFFF